MLNELVNSAINNRNNVLRDEIEYDDMLTGDVEIAGEPLNTFYSYRFKGLSPVDGSPIFTGQRMNCKRSWPKNTTEWNAKMSF